MPVRHFYLLSHYICDGLFFLFSVFWFQKEWIQHYICNYQPFPFLCFGSGVNAIVFGEIKGRGQKTTACSEGISFRRENDILQQYNDEFIMYSDSLRYHLIISETWKKIQHSENSIRISHNILSPSPSLSKDYCIHSFWSQNTEKRNHTLSQMRLRSVFKMRMSILNTATTEQMG